MGLGLKMYADDNHDTLSPKDSRQFEPTAPYTNHASTLGGKNAPQIAWVARGTDRLLYPYVRAFEAFRCPADKGQNFPAAGGARGGPWKPSNYDAVGCSYRFNAYLSGNRTRQDADAPLSNLAGKKVSWAPNPSLFIMVHEPPAFVYADEGNLVFHWHYARGATTLPVGQLKADNQKFISPILFVDGSASTHDFTKAIRDDPTYPLEPTKDWIWYKPRD